MLGRSLTWSSSESLSSLLWIVAAAEDSGRSLRSWRPELLEEGEEVEVEEVEVEQVVVMGVVVTEGGAVE